MTDAGLREIHEIMEKIHAEEADMPAAQRVHRLREESEAFMRERKLELQRVKPVSSRDNRASA